MKNGTVHVVVVLILTISFTTLLTAADLEQKPYDAGATVGIWTGGDIDVEGFTAEKDSSLLFHLFYDYYLMPKLATGLYINFAPNVVIGNGDGEVMSEFGFSIMPRFLVSENLAVKPALQMGYRTSTVGDESMDGFGLNMNCQFYYLPDPSNKIAYIGEIGFLAQPVGGTDFVDVSFAPIFYFSAGVSL
jgi:hypothetical protein